MNRRCPAAKLPHPSTKIPKRAMSLGIGPRLLLCDLAGAIITALWFWAGQLTADAVATPDFQPAAIDGGQVLNVVPLMDGRVLLTGWFNRINGIQATGIARLNADGSLDTSFRPPIFDNPAVYTVLPLTDGTLWIAGGFQLRAGNLIRTGLAKLDTNGVFMTTSPNLPISGEIRSLALDEAGRLLVGGSFVLNRARSKANLIRLLPNNAVDETLNPNAFNEANSPTINGMVIETTLLPEGRILIAGYFNSVRGLRRNGLAIISSDGTPDPAFAFDADHDCCILDVDLDAQGRILVGGSFLNFFGRGHRGVIRVTMDGQVDSTFHLLPGPQSYVKSISASEEERVLLAGMVSQTSGTNRFGLTELFSDGEINPAWRREAGPAGSGEFIKAGVNGESFYLEMVAPLNYRLERFGPGSIPPQAPRILAEPTDLTVAEGSTVHLLVDEVAFPRAAYQWTFNGALIPNGTNRVFRITNVTPAAIGAYQLQIQNGLGNVRSRAIQLFVTPAATGPGHVDLGDTTSGTFGDIWGVQPLQDGGCFVMGSFSRIHGVPRASLARLTANGDVEPSFDPQTGDYANVIYAQTSTNGAVVVMGWTNAPANNGSRSRIIRLTPEGAFDPTFRPYLSPLNQSFSAICPDATGRVYVSGPLNNLSSVFRLLTDGTRDTTYRLETDGPPFQMILLPDGKLLLFGGFNMIGGKNRHRLARLNSDGTVDDTFVVESLFAESNVERVLVQPDGKILVAAATFGFGWWGGGTPPRTRLIRFNADGSLDSTFTPEIDPTQQILGFTIQPSGSVIMASTPYQFTGVQPFSLRRLFHTGDLDYAFHTETLSNGWINQIAALGTDRLLVFGGFTEFGGVPRNRIARLSAGPPSPTAPIFHRYPVSERIPEGANLTLETSIEAVPLATLRWQKDGVDLPGQTNRTLVITNASTNDTGNYQAVASNTLGAAVSPSTRLDVDAATREPGQVDLSFYAGAGPNSSVTDVVELPDGKFLIVGEFSSVDSQPRRRIARLYPDGTLDQEFNPPAGPDAEVSTAVVLPDGQIVIGGLFGQIGTSSRSYVAVLRPNGTLNSTNRITANARVTQLLVDKEGRILICGEQNVSRWRITGARDTAFKEFTFDGVALAMALRSDDKIVVVGGFSRDGVVRRNIARLEPNGAIDETFKVGLGPNDRIDDVAIQPDGKIIVVGTFTTFDGAARGCVARLNPDGSLDSDFEVGRGAQGGRVVPLGHFGLREATAVHSVLLERSGNILLGGEFSSFEGMPAGSIARLYPDGSLDSSFGINGGFPSPQTIWAPAFNEFQPLGTRWVTRLRPASNDRIMVAGAFPELNRVARSRVVQVITGDLPPTAPIVKAQSSELTARTGTNLLFYVQVQSSPQATFQWFKNGEAIPDATRAFLELNNVNGSTAGEYTCLVSNRLGAVQQTVAKLRIDPPRIEPGAVDVQFAGSFFPPGQINAVTADGENRLILAGAIQPFNGPWQPWLTRLTSMGTVDLTADARSLEIQSGNLSRGVSLSDGSLLVNGSLESNGQVRHWALIKPDGSLDASFKPPRNLAYSHLLVTLASGKFAGVADVLSGAGPRLFRLNSDGSLDTNLTRVVTFDAAPLQMAEDPQGRLIVAGDFNMVGSIRRSRIVRFLPDGSIDPTFESKDLPDGGINGLAFQSDGRLLLSGWFSAIGSAAKPRLARLSADGKVDPDFPASDLALYNGNINSIAVDREDRIVLAGYFQISVDGQTAFQVLRLLPDGTLDSGFDIGEGFQTDQLGRFLNNFYLGITPTGKIMVVGTFEKVDGLPRRQLVRLLSETQPRLGLQRRLASGKWAFYWDEGDLEQAPSLLGPWQKAEDAAQPWTLEPVAGQQFFRLRIEQ